MHHSYRPNWVQTDMLTTSDEELAEVAPYLSSALSGKDLLNGVHLNAHFNKLSVEPYNLNCFAQQFGLILGVRAPYQSVAYTHDRPSLVPLELKQLVTTNNNKLVQFQFKPFMVNLGTISAYLDWWVSIFS